MFLLHFGIPDVGSAIWFLNVLDSFTTLTQRPCVPLCGIPFVEGLYWHTPSVSVSKSIETSRAINVSWDSESHCSIFYVRSGINR